MADGLNRDGVEGTLRALLKDLFELDHQGGRGDKLARAHGYADGYMRALVDLGAASQKELLEIVLDERRRAAEVPTGRVALGRVKLERAVA
jgi:hypothetical protein